MRAEIVADSELNLSIEEYYQKLISLSMKESDFAVAWPEKGLKSLLNQEVEG